MKLRVLWFGRSTQSSFEDQVATYCMRVCRRWPAEDVAIKPCRGGRSDDPDRARTREAAAAQRVIPAGWPTVALDEGGRRLDSQGFAHFVDGFEQKGADGVVFVIGSDLGLDGTLRRQADATLSLSALTLPHVLARLLLWEQLFRATHILGGGPYHRPAPTLKAGGQ